MKNDDAPKHMTPYSSTIQEGKKQKVKKISKHKLIAGGILFVLIFGFAMTAVVYRSAPSDQLVRKIVNIFPYPAVKINGTTLTIKEYLVEHDALTSFFGDAVDRPSDEELEHNIIDTMLNKVVIKLLSEQYGIELDQTEVDVLLNDVMASAENTEAFEKEILETFGWTADEFRARVVEPIVLATQISTHISASEELQAEKREQIDTAHKRLEDGEVFTLVASETNDDRSAIFGGDLGYLLEADLPEEWQAELEGLLVEEYTSVIESTDGFAILYLGDRITVEEDEQIQLFAILVRKRAVEEFVDEYLEAATVKRYLGKE